MKPDLILAVMKNVNMWDVDCFAISLGRTGYTGRKVFFVENVQPDARSFLIERGFELIDFTTSAEALSVHFQTSRYTPAAEFLAEHRDEFNYVMWTDVWDVVFQEDPFQWVRVRDSAPSHSLVAAREGWKIKDQAINDIWIRKLVLDEEYARLREQEVLCAGTIFGDVDMMGSLLMSISNWSRSSSDMQGLDQGMLNVLARRPGFKEYFIVPGTFEGLVATCGPFLAPSDPSTWTIEPPFFERETGLVWTSQLCTKLFSVVHQYNRNNGPLNLDGAWRGILERRYRG